MILGPLMEKRQVVALVGLGIRVELGALLMEEEFMVLMQPSRPQMPFVVNHIIFVMECLFYLQKELDYRFYHRRSLNDV